MKAIEKTHRTEMQNHFSIYHKIWLLRLTNFLVQDLHVIVLRHLYRLYWHGAVLFSVDYPEKWRVDRLGFLYDRHELTNSMFIDDDFVSDIHKMHAAMSITANVPQGDFFIRNLADERDVRGHAFYWIAFNSPCRNLEEILCMIRTSLPGCRPMRVEMQIVKDHPDRARGNLFIHSKRVDDTAISGNNNRTLIFQAI